MPQFRMPLAPVCQDLLKYREAFALTIQIFDVLLHVGTSLRKKRLPILNECLGEIELNKDLLDGPLTVHLVF